MSLYQENHNSVAHKCIGHAFGMYDIKVNEHLKKECGKEFMNSKTMKYHITIDTNK
jgi:hypothetical protein